MDFCRVCGEPPGNRTFLAREKMFGLGDEFSYIECAHCGSLLLADLPADLSRYYPADYYSLAARRESWLKRFVKRAWTRQGLGKSSPLGRVLVRRLGTPPLARYLKPTGVDFGAPVLDVGSGAGTLLMQMSNAGFRNLTGVDPYVAGDSTPARHVRILKRQLEEVEGRYDLVLLHHVLEHLPEPDAVLRHVGRLLPPGKFALITVPVAGNYAWRHYGTDWVQLDAPRHLFVPSEMGMHLLAGRGGFAVERVVYDSTSLQFWGSEQYRRGISLMDGRSCSVGRQEPVFTPDQIRTFEERARELNVRRDGDQASFYLRRVEDQESSVISDQSTVNSKKGMPSLITDY